MQKLLIRGATIATSSNVFTGDLLVEGGKIAALGESLPPPQDAEILEAGGLYLLPGGVDVHTHMDLDVGFTRASDDFYTGTVAAACGGTTTIVDHMAFGPKDCALTHQPRVYRELARDAVIDYGFHGTLQHVDDEVLRDMETLRDEWGITSLKLYLTYADMLTDADALRVLQRAQQLGLVICAHCENDAIVNSLRAQLIAEGKTSAACHPLSRPARAEAEAVFRFLALAKAAGEAKAYVVHLSSAEGYAALKEVQRTGQRHVGAETCPQYLVLDESRYDDPVEGLKYIMSPPLRPAEDAESLWQGLAEGRIQTVGTDHCPFFFATQKQRGKDDFTQCPNGAPGVELRMPLLFSEGYVKGRLTLPQLVGVCCTNPARMFGLGAAKGDIALGMDADLVLFDPTAQYTVTRAQLHENVDYTPYEGMQLTGRPVLTLSRGEVIARDGEFTGQKGRGKYLKRSLGIL